MPTVLALDPGSVSMAYCAMDEHGRVLASGVLQLCSSCATYCQMCTASLNFIDALIAQLRPDDVCIEQQMRKRYVCMQAALGTAAMARNLPVEMVSAVGWKRRVGARCLGSHSANKQEAVRVARCYGYALDERYGDAMHNQADAILIALGYVTTYYAT